jgi:hypothetical protein
MALGFEAINSLLWASRVASAAVVYDAVVLLLLSLRVAVTAGQGTAAWLLTVGASQGWVLARWAIGSSAILLAAELGARLAPSSLQPGLRLPAVAGYALYAAVCWRLVRFVERADSE